MKYITTPNTSTIVIIAGVAITAGSIFNNFTNRGSAAPIIDDKTTCNNRDIPTVIAIINDYL